MQHGGVAPGLPPEAIAANLASPYKTRLCRHFLQSAKCAYGASCNFAHGEAELRETPRRGQTELEAGAQRAPRRRSRSVELVHVERDNLGLVFVCFLWDVCLISS